LRLLSNGNFGIGVLSPQTNLHVNGDIRFNMFSGMGQGLLKYDNDGNLLYIQFTGNANNVLLGDGTFGTLNIDDNDWKISNNNLLTIPTGNVGIGTTQPQAKLDINGNAIIRGTLHVFNGIIVGTKYKGEKVEVDTVKSERFEATKMEVEEIEASKEVKVHTIKIDGINSRISSTTGLIDFENTNLKTTGNIYADNLFIQSSINIGNFKFSNGGIIPVYPIKDTIQTPNKIAIVSGANLITLDADTVIVPKQIGIGIDKPQYSLDVAGDAHFRDLLWVEGGLIIGERYEGGKADIDTLNTKTTTAEKMTTDTLIVAELTSDTIKSKKVKVHTINIDGINSRISSTTGLIDFENTNLKTTGTINANTISTDNLNVNYTSFDSLHVINRLKIGTNSLIVGTHCIGTDEILSSAGKIIFGGSPDLLDIQIGIGTDDPLQNLHVKGRTCISSQIPDPDPESTILRIEDEVVNDQGSFLGSAYWDIIVSGLTPNNRLYFQSSDPLTPNLAALTIEQNGNIGIGTENPVEKLDINGNLRIRNNDIYCLLSGADNGLGWYGTATASGGKALFAGQDVGGMVLYGHNGGALGIRNTSSGIENIALQWDVDGNVGIGLSNPSAKLHINADAMTGMILDLNHTAGFGFGIRIKTNNDWTKALTVVGNDGYQKFVLYGNGNIAIGDKIHTPYSARLMVDGKIIAEEIEIKVLNWADYVFVDEYKLLSIEEIENFINRNGHLPNVPSAKEIEENGMQVGEMVNTLLEKIEELTLYIIEQDKRIKELEEKSK